MISGAFAFDGPRLDPQTLRSWITTEEASSHGIQEWYATSASW